MIGILPVKTLCESFSKKREGGNNGRTGMVFVCK